jgi:hypothetical protein
MAEWKLAQKSHTFDGKPCVADILSDRGHVIEQRVKRLLAPGEVYTSPKPEPTFRVYRDANGPTLQPPIVDNRLARSKDPEILLQMGNLNQAEKAILSRSKNECLDRLAHGHGQSD